MGQQQELALGVERRALHALAIPGRPDLHAAVRGIETVWTLGGPSELAARACGGRHFAHIDALLAALADGPHAASVLVKGSRSMRMERVVHALQEQADAA